MNQNVGEYSLQEDTIPKRHLGPSGGWKSKFLTSHSGNLKDFVLFNALFLLPGVNKLIVTLKSGLGKKSFFDCLSQRVVSTVSRTILV